MTHKIKEKTRTARYLYLFIEEPFSDDGGGQSYEIHVDGPHVRIPDAGTFRIVLLPEIINLLEKAKKEDTGLEASYEYEWLFEEEPVNSETTVHVISTFHEDKTGYFNENGLLRFLYSRVGDIIYIHYNGMEALALNSWQVDGFIEAFIHLQNQVL